MGTQNVSAVVCTRNSIASIEKCLASLRNSGVGQLIVVDADSTDGTKEVAESNADLVLEDPGTGLGNARNIGIARTTQPLILNMGSDNVMPSGQLQIMIDSLERRSCQGVSAQTLIAEVDYVSFGLNAWRRGRFKPGPAAVIGTPTLFLGDALRKHPYDPRRVFSDDSELCERWTKEFGATFAISDAFVYEVGKTSWQEVRVRCRMYGISDEEIFRLGRARGWTFARQVRSVLHPARADFASPLKNLPIPTAVAAAPFLVTFTGLRYAGWLEATVLRHNRRRDSPSETQ